MKILLLADFGGSFPEALKRRLKGTDFDIVLCAGDFADIKAIRELFLKWGDKYEEMYDKMKKEQKDIIKRKRKKSADKVLKGLNSLGRPVYLVSGNNEIYEYEEFVHIVSKYKNCRLIDGKAANLKNISIIGNRNEMLTRTEEAFGETEERLYYYQEVLLDRNFRKAKSKNIILLNHNPPFGCRLDRLPKAARQNPGKHIGSHLIKEVIKKYRPVFLVCGHLEELRGTCRIGNTVIINPGGADKGKYAVMEVGNGDFRKSKIIFYPYSYPT